MAAFVAYNARKDSLNDVVVLHVEVSRLVSKAAILVSRLNHPDRPAHLLRVYVLTVLRPASFAFIRRSCHSARAIRK